MRVVNRLLAFMLGAALAVASAIALVEMVAGLMNRGPVVIARSQLVGTLGRVRWDDPLMVAVAVTLVVLGILLLVAAFMPARPEQLPLRRPPGAAASIDRRGLQERLRTIALRDPDIAGATVRVGRVIKVTAAAIQGTDRQACHDRLQKSIGGAVDELELARPRPLRTKVETTQERTR